VDILRVVTLNIWNNQGPWPERLRLIRKELPTLDAHLVGLIDEPARELSDEFLHATSRCPGS